MFMDFSHFVVFVYLSQAEERRLLLLFAEKLKLPPTSLRCGEMDFKLVLSHSLMNVLKVFLGEQH